ncbi:MAG: MFS transporter [Bacteroidota bacterium]|nr:MFS transporter [Bacteroidota bacterium]MDW8136832.1 MFS transporter [Bacteroidota bacterium]
MRPVRKRRWALRLVVLFGVISLLADATYEGARALAGPFLATLGATASAIGAISGAGELLGYLFRLLSGYWADRSRRYWLLMGTGYAINLGAVPLLALVGHWQWAAALLLLERIGKGLRTPARDLILSYASAPVGRGWAFGLHEALDQMGAVLGPLLVAAILGARENYALAFAALAVPATLALAVLGYARLQYPRPELLESAEQQATGRPAGRYPAAFGWYLAAAAALAIGYADFPLIGYHAERLGLLSARSVAALYALAMAVDAASALCFGRWFDRSGLWALMGALLLSAASAPFAFAEHPEAVVAGAILWGIGMGAQESVLRAEIARLIAPQQRGRAYGIFNACFGAAWFGGSLVMGALYDRALLGAVVAWSVGFQLLALLLVALTIRKAAPSASERP